MKKALFIDRDGTVIAEPPADYQVDSLEKLEFIPGAISALRTLRGLDFELVMAKKFQNQNRKDCPHSLLYID